LNVSNLQSTTSLLDNDAMQTSRMWESLCHKQQTSDHFFNRAYSSGRVAFSIPSNYFQNLANRSIIESATIDSLTEEFGLIEQYYIQQLKEGKAGSEIDEKVRAALVQKVAELKTTTK
jgi:hypothetical protein